MTLAELTTRLQTLQGSTVTATDHSKQGVNLDITIASNVIPELARLMSEAKFALEAITGVDWLAEQQIEIVYDFTSYTSGIRVAARTRVSRETPEVATISDVHPGANWHERESHDFFGITFTGHPGLIPLLLPEDADFHPLRKDYGA
jgi:NADH-quinone oxidoreductase subunit C